MSRDAVHHGASHDPIHRVGRPQEPQIPPTIDAAEARRLDGRILDLMSHRRLRSLAMCRCLYLIRQGAFEHLGFETFDAYVEARGIRRARAHFLSGVYQKLAVELEIPEREWLGIPLSRLHGLLKWITPHTWRPFLRDARAMSRRQFRNHLRKMHGRQMNLPHGTYRLEKADRPARREPDTALTLRLGVFQDREDGWIADHYPVEMPVTPSQVRSAAAAARSRRGHGGHSGHGAASPASTRRLSRG